MTTASMALQAVGRAGRAILCSVSLLGLALGCDSTESQAQAPQGSETVQGTVQSFTKAPKGEVDGAVLDNGTTLHWPPHMQDRFTDVIRAGDRVRATGRMETGPAGDTHFEVQGLVNVRSQARAENPDFANGPPPPPPGPRGRDRGPADKGDGSTVRGKVQRFTTAPKGEVDGAVLDDGTWLHWPPHMQDRFANILKEGDRVRATGRTETGPKGDTHFEVQSVTNLRSNTKAENPGFANGPPPPPPGRGVAPAADREQRLRDLEDQVEQLRREIQRLRRER
jgi:hypothetical protein